mgnify:CR=1 FL=1
MWFFSSVIFIYSVCVLDVLFGVRIFKFKNTGNAPLIVSDVKSSCGCTIPKKPKDPIMPGESGEIEVKYDTKRVAPIRKTVTVISNADTTMQRLVTRRMP